MLCCGLVRALRLIILTYCLVSAPGIWCQTAPFVDVLASELNRNFEVLKGKGSPPAYFMSYSVSDATEDVVRASFGALLRSASDHRRAFDCSVRVGSPQLDNYHKLDGQQARFTRALALPLEDIANPIRRLVWLETDRCYQAAVQRLAEINSRIPNDGGGKGAVLEFSPEPAAVSLLRSDARKLDRDAWTNRLRKLSAGFLEFPGVLQSEIMASNHSSSRIVVNTDGTRVQIASNVSRVVITSRAKASDGEDLELYDSFESFDPEKLPNDNTLLQALILQADLMQRLKRAPETDPYVGPAIFSARAAAVLFHEVLGHGLESRGADGAPLTSRLNQTILPSTYTVVSAPTITQAGPYDLIGSYSHDDEGVTARPVVVVENGVLKSLLLSRTPTAGFPQSNGHGRRQSGFEVVARQSNLFVDSTATVKNDDLRANLVAEVTRQGKPYGLYIERLRVGNPIPGPAGVPIRPILIVAGYRIFASGRKEELIRGAALDGDLLKIFEKITMTSDFKQALNLYDQGESGTVPVSIVAPPFLTSVVQIKRTAKPSDRPPFLPGPQRN